MPLPALQKFERKIERHLRLLELSKTVIERNIGRQIRLFEQKRNGIGKKIEERIRQFERKRGIRLDDEVRFLRSWIERPLTIGAVTPSGKFLARTMARYVDPHSDGPVVELGPGTGPVTEALVQAGVSPARLVLVEFNPDVLPHPARALSGRHAGAGRRLQPAPPARNPVAAAGRRSRLRPAAGHQTDRMRLRLIRDAFDLMLPGAPFVQFTYSVASPLPTRLGGFSAEASERIWMNLPPARVWVYRKSLTVL